jgi:glycosyltransferase involved in cell wall biosynthesis
MKIVFFVHCFFPDHFYGTETYTLELARHYKSWGHDVTVVSAIFQGEPSAAALVTRYEYQAIPVVCIDKNLIPHSRVKETYYQSEIRSTLEKVLLDLQPDVVHVTHLINHTSVLLEVTQALGVPTYATFTDFFGFCLTNKLEDANGKLCKGPSPSRTNCVACYIKEVSRSSQTSGWMRHGTTPRSARWLATGANLVRKLPGVRAGAIDGLLEDIARRPDTLGMLYNAGYKAAATATKFLRDAYASNGIRVPMHGIWFGVDIDQSPKPTRASSHRPVIGFIGQLAPHKGTDLLIEAFRRIPKGASELRIYGPSDQDHAYMASLNTLADGYDVKFMGTFAKERMAEVLREIDLLVIPSRWYENSPLVLLNSLATHTPVLVSDVAGMTEFLSPGLNGDSFERGNVDDLELKLRNLVESHGHLEVVSRTTHFVRTSEVMAKETLQLYGF